MFATLFRHCKFQDKKYLEMEVLALETVSNVNVLTQSQQTP
jgi:hypothetical protein